MATDGPEWSPLAEYPTDEIADALEELGGERLACDVGAAAGYAPGTAASALEQLEREGRVRRRDVGTSTLWLLEEG